MAGPVPQQGRGRMDDVLAPAGPRTANCFENKHTMELDPIPRLYDFDHDEESAHRAKKT
jgi:hypothetical protein